MPASRRPPARWTLAFAALLVAGGCATAPTATPAATASPTATETANPTPTEPIASLPAGCAQEAEALSTQPRVSIVDITTTSYPGYDVLIFDFDRGLPEYAVSHVQPPFVRDPSGLPLDVQGSDFFSVVLRGASIVDEEFQPAYEGPTDLLPALPRIRQVVLAGDFEAVSSWLVGLEAPACLAVQAFDGKRLVIAFVDPRVAT